MRMRFYNPAMTKEFVGLCRRLDLHGTIREGVPQVVNVEVKTAKEQRALIARWAKASVVTEKVDG
jgi:hypothetical protein